MAYTTGAATDMGDLLTKLDAFLTGTPSSTVLGGYTQDDFDDGATTSTEGFAAWHKGSTGSGLWISMRWQADAPNNLAIYQALGHTASNDPGTHPDDSGNGYNTTTAYTDSLLDDERCCNDVGDGPFVSYHFFGDATLDYCYVVVEIASERFRHFGWGNLEKFNDWTGGEFCFGHYAREGTNNTPVQSTTTVLLDGLANSTSSTARRAATIHAEGLPNQGGSEKWLIHLGGAADLDSADRTDRAGETKRVTFGGARGGPIAHSLAQFQSDVATGHIPMYPMGIFLRDFTNEYIYILGKMPDVVGIDIKNFAAGQEITSGSDTWVVFPQAKRTEDNVTDRTYYQGFAYRKVTA